MYGKHFESMYEGSMYGAGLSVFAVWGYVIAHVRKSKVELNPKKLSDTLGGSVEEIEEAINTLMSPDPDSRHKEHDGRRLIREGQFQYFVPSWESYQGIRNADDRREYNRLKQQEYRKRRKDFKNAAQCEGAREAIADGFAEQRSFLPPHKDSPPPTEKRKAFTKPTTAEMELQAAKIGLPASEITHFFDYYESNGWKVGRNPMRSWQGAMANWKRNHENNRYRTTQGSTRTNPQSNPRNVGVIKGPTDYGAAARRKLEREQETGVARQVDSPPGQPPATGGTGKLGL
jgi:hypothetical protein